MVFRGEKMPLANKKIIIFAEKEFEDLELLYPKLRLIEEGASVIVSGLGEKVYHGKNGYPVNADSNIENENPDNYDALIIPGGWAPDYLRRVTPVLDFVKKMNRQKKIIAFICHAGWVPISAGILKGRKVTGVDAIKHDLINAGATYLDAAVVVDGNLISSRRPPDLPMFCREIINALSK